MSRRPAPNPALDRGAQNQQTLKTLVKVESNKSCADCKRNKHPRWASWNLGIFLCIRCSGIHRGMGTHISRVKSVDLDAWTDEQLQSILRWGNARANKYWEAKLAPGHVPAEAKIENFIRTKYESRRWVMDGPMPDPSTLDVAADDEVPLNIVQEKAKLERASSQRTASAPSQQPPQASRPPPRQQIDLFGDDPPSAPIKEPSGRSISAEPSRQAQPQPPRPQVHQQRQSRTGDSLLGFDFFGSTSSNPPSRPSSAAPTTPSGGAATSRPDLKQSILSLYASAPKAAPQQQHSRNSSSTQANPMDAPASSGGSAFDAFSSLSISSPGPQSPPARPSQSSPFSNLSSPQSQFAVPSQTASTSNKPPPPSGGNFFGMTSMNPTSPPQQKPQAPRPQRGLSNDFGDFTSAASPVTSAPAPAPAPAPPKQKPAIDLFDLNNEPPKPPPTQWQSPPASNTLNSPFNLSSPKVQSPPVQPARKATQAPSGGGGGFNMDPWGSSDVWATSEPAAPPAPAPVPMAAPPAPKAAPTISASTADDWGWSSNNGASSGPVKVTQDEDFGGWESGASPVAAPPAPTSSSNTFSSSPANPTPKPAFSGGDDLFSNVWE